MSFFEKYPTITYNKLQMKNLMLKANLISDVFSKFEVFYPYIVEDNERADTISYDYYGSSDYWWVVLMSNGIVDPYHDWPLTYNDFRSHIIKKYGSIATAMSTIKHYTYTGIGGESEEDINRKNWVMPIETHANLSPIETSGWTPVYAYDYEEELNDSKRSIQLLDRSYIPQINKELKIIFND